MMKNRRVVHHRKGWAEHSTLFSAYQTLKNLEERGKTRKAVMRELMGKFGEKNPEVNVMAT